jgi:hypothetical protein
MLTYTQLRLIQARPNFLQAKLTIEKEHLNKFKVRRSPPSPGTPTSRASS